MNDLTDLHTIAKQLDDVGGWPMAAVSVRWAISEIERLRGAVAGEREECAKVCDDAAVAFHTATHRWEQSGNERGRIVCSSKAHASELAAAAIRARSEMLRPVPGQEAARTKPEGQ